MPVEEASNTGIENISFREAIPRQRVAALKKQINYHRGNCTSTNRRKAPVKMGMARPSSTTHKLPGTYVDSPNRPD